MFESTYRMLSAPIIRKAESSDIEGLVKVIATTEHPFISDTFGEDRQRVYNFYKDVYEMSIEGLYVLVDGPDIVGVMKLHLPLSKITNTIKFSTLFRHFGLFRGIRIGIHLSTWDEYQLRKGESYLEYLYLIPGYENTNAERLMIDKAMEIAMMKGAKWMSHFVKNYPHRVDILERRGFFQHRRARFRWAQLLYGDLGWEKYIIPMVNTPITMKAMVKARMERARVNLIRMRRQYSFTFKFLIALLTMPITYGTLAYIRGFHLATAWWVIVFLSHLCGLLLVFVKRHSGVFIMIAAIMLESGNMILRSISTEKWPYRTWLISITFMNVFSAYVLFRAMRMNYYASTIVISEQI